MNERILFVTKGGEGIEEGFSYVIWLAKALNTGISVLIVFKKSILGPFEDVMSAIAYAEAGERETVKQLLNQRESKMRESAEMKMRELEEKCSSMSISMTYQVEFGDALDAVRDVLNTRSGIEMVLLSPSLSEDKNIIDVKKLIKNVTKTVVTLSRPAEAEGLSTG